MSSGEVLVRLVFCPVCGLETETTCIGPVHCGPHKMGEGDYRPTVEMREITASWRAAD